MSYNSVPENEQLPHPLTLGNPTPEMLIDTRHTREVLAWLPAAEQPHMKEGETGCRVQKCIAGVPHSMR